MKVIAVVPQGLEEVAAKELFDLGVNFVKPLKRSVFFEADKKSFYRVHLMSRIPFRFLRQVASFSCNSPNSLYYKVQKSFDWESWLPPSFSFRVDVTGQTYALNHTHFSALQVKNAIVDLQRELWGKRSNIQLNEPDICIHLHLANGNAVLSLDSSTQSMHKRGYRALMGIAPLKENLAAGLIRLTEWDGTKPFVDPCCGSGTFLIEACSIALGLPPGLNRSFLFERWPDFDVNLWKEEREIAKKKFNNIDFVLPKIIGCENSLQIANQAKINICNAGLEEFIDIKVCTFQELILPNEKGVILCNPPYGKRISDELNLINLYKELGNFCKKNAKGWSFWILNGSPKLSKFLYMKSKRRFPVSNGGIDCRWINYLIN